MLIDTLIDSVLRWKEMFGGEDVKIKERHKRAIYAAQISHHESGMASVNM